MIRKIAEVWRYINHPAFLRSAAKGAAYTGMFASLPCLVFLCLAKGHLGWPTVLVYLALFIEGFVISAIYWREDRMGRFEEKA